MTQVVGTILYMSIEAAFWKIHDGLPRQAPGSDATTKHLLRLTGMEKGKCLDIGCGQGRASLILAEAGFEVVATDTHQPFLDQLDRKVKSKNLDSMIKTRNVSMSSLDFSDETFNLVWSEGSAYILGWGEALKSWKRLIAKDGLLVVTECCWLTDRVSAEPKQFWVEAYPSMLTVNGARQVAIDIGYTVVSSYILPANDWWYEYYDPLLERVRVLRPGADRKMSTALDMTQHEIDIYERYSEEYGYVGFVLKRS